ncbi:MAG: Asp-tRNA(Asn)/Glu-tRNA(Gln) amidotransferase subunit GatB [Flavisolibacter sp.]
MQHADQYEIVIGLEVHAQLLTRTKLFCGDSTLFGKEPNTQISIVSLGYPGTLPRMNREAIALAVRLGLACHCTIVQHNYFARKNYFYPDLPKGYQISQHTTPICRGGIVELMLGKNSRKIRLNRIHIEEDAGKMVHDAESHDSCLDFNRAGMPLLEIVSEPDLRSAEEASTYVSTLRKLVRYLGVCDGNMEEGSLRCDVNISVRKKGDQKLGTKVEIKNLNSIRFIKKAVEYESARLIARLENAEPILQETRGFDENSFTTYSIRTKEDEDDYRYFPEPDLPPFVITNDFIEQVRKQMPPLPDAIRQRLVTEFGLPLYDAEQIADDQELSQFFLNLSAKTRNYKAASNWVMGPIKNHVSTNEVSLEELGFRAESFAELIRLIDEGRISYGIAVQKIFPALIKDPSLKIEGFIEQQGLFVQSEGNEIEGWIESALNKHAQKIGEYRKGKKGLISLFVGEVMKQSGGRADAQLVTKKILEKLNT